MLADGSLCVVRAVSTGCKEYGEGKSAGRSGTGRFAAWNAGRRDYQQLSDRSILFIGLQTAQQAALTSRLREKRRFAFQNAEN